MYALIHHLLKRISIRYSGDAYSFQCGMQLLMWSENVMVYFNGYKKLEGMDMLLKKIFFWFVMSCVLVERSAIPETNT